MKQRIVFAAIMSFITAGIVAFTLVVVNLGFTDRFVIIWLRSWSIACPVAACSILFIGPKVQAFVGYLFRRFLI